MYIYSHMGPSQVALLVKNPPTNAGDIKDSFNPWVRKIPWRRAWQPNLVFLPGEFHRQRNLVGNSQQVTNSQTQLKWLCTHAHMLTYSLPRWCSGKERTCQCTCRRQVWSQVGKIPWCRKWPKAWKITWTEETGGLYIVHGVAKSWAQLSNWAHMYA